MAIEIERKFLVRGTGWKNGAVARQMRQGYLSDAKDRTVRVRVAGDQAWLTIKGPGDGVTRPEFEYAIPVADARVMLDDLCHRPLLDKTRHEVMHDGHKWEVDEFHGDNAGLIIAEIELRDPQEAFSRPDWLGAEVTGDHRYYNANLARRPFSRWGRD